MQHLDWLIACAVHEFGPALVVHDLAECLGRWLAVARCIGSVLASPPAVRGRIKTTQLVI